MQFVEQFKAARRVSTPLLAIRTFDAKSTIDNVRNTLGSKLEETPIILWDAMHGMRPLTNKAKEVLSALLGEVPIDATVDLATSLRIAESATQDAIIFLSNAHLVYSEPVIIQGIWNLRNPYKSNGNMLVMLVSPGAVLPSEIVNDVLVLDEPLPTRAELETIILDTFKSTKKGKEGFAPDASVIDKALDALIGLPAFSAEQACAMCLDTKSMALDIAELWERKRQIISQTPGLSVYGGKETLSDIGGIESIKTFCRALMTGRNAPKTIIFTDEVEKAFAGTGTDMSGVKTELTGSMLSWTEDKEIDGLLLLGVPGCAKSALSKALGGEYGTPVVNFDLAGMQSSLVGSSGSNLRSAQRTVEAISGGRILWIATCNSVNGLPAELLSRFKLGTFFFAEPDTEERSAIWKLYRAKYEIPANDPGPVDDGWTGREIKECAYKAWRMNLTLREAARYVVPVTRSNRKGIEALKLSASNNYLSASKPGEYVYHGDTEPTTMHLSPNAFPVQVSARKMREEN